MHPFLKHLIPVEANVGGSLSIVSSITREKNAEISLAGLGIFSEALFDIITLTNISNPHG